MQYGKIIAKCNSFMCTFSLKFHAVKLLPMLHFNDFQHMHNRVTCVFQLILLQSICQCYISTTSSMCTSVLYAHFSYILLQSICQYYISMTSSMCTSVLHAHFSYILLQSICQCYISMTSSMCTSVLHAHFNYILLQLRNYNSLCFNDFLS